MPSFQYTEPRLVPPPAPAAPCLQRSLCTWNFQLNNTWMKSPHLTVLHDLYTCFSGYFCMQGLASVLELLIKTWCTAESLTPPAESRGWWCVFTNKPMLTNLLFLCEVQCLALGLPTRGWRFSICPFNSMHKMHKISLRVDNCSPSSVRPADALPVCTSK